MNLDQWMILLLTEHIVGIAVGIWGGYKFMIWRLKKHPMLGKLL